MQITIAINLSKLVRNLLDIGNPRRQYRYTLNFAVFEELDHVTAKYL